MKYLTIMALLGSFTVYAQNFSPSASGTSITSPSGSIAPNSLASSGAGTSLRPLDPSSTFVNPPVDTGSIPNSNFNTAPTNVPSGQPGDTVLLNNLNNSTTTPSNNPPAQAQEFNPFPDTSISPSGSGTGFGTGTGTGTGSDNNIINGTSPITSP